MKNYINPACLLSLLLFTQQSWSMQVPDWTCGTYDIATVESDRSLFKDFKWESIDFENMTQGGTILIHPKEILFHRSNKFMRIEYSLSVGNISQASDATILDTTTGLYSHKDSGMSFHCTNDNYVLVDTKYFSPIPVNIKPETALLWKNAGLEKLWCSAGSSFNNIQACYFTSKDHLSQQDQYIIGILNFSEKFINIGLRIRSPVYYMKFNNDSTLLAIATEKKIFLIKPAQKPYGSKVAALKKSNDVKFHFT